MPITINNALMASTQVQNQLRTATEYGQSSADCPLLSLEEYTKVKVKVKSRVRLWDANKAQAHEKHEFMKGGLRMATLKVARDLPHPLTQEEKEDKAAVVDWTVIGRRGMMLLCTVTTSIGRKEIQR
jgi:hypothetical protein